MKIIFWISVFLIFWAMVGYQLSILLLGKFTKKQLQLDPTIIDDVTILVVAHNEEKVIQKKLENLLQLDYPKEHLYIVVSSDHSTDQTNYIVETFIQHHPTSNIRLFKVQQRKGKTNAQNEAVKTIHTPYLVMTDANAMLDKQAIKQLLASFTSEDIAYVCGALLYDNTSIETGENEAVYWNLELKIRKIESNLQTITAGNGALYACKTRDYFDIDLIQSHDSAFPLLFALKNKRCLFNPKAICFEKAGETYADEYKRKVRMNRSILFDIIPTLKIFNVFKYRWFTYFYFGHRSLRYSLWLLHLICFITNLFLIHQPLYFVLMLLQILFYSIAICKKIFNINYKFFNLVYYYTITIVAQYHGVYNIITGKSKPFWDKAESTR